MSVGGVGSRRDRRGGYGGQGEGRVQGCPEPTPSYPVINCSIIWTVFIAGDYNLLLLVEFENPTRKYFQVVSYDLGNWDAVGG